MRLLVSSGLFYYVADKSSDLFAHSFGLCANCVFNRFFKGNDDDSDNNQNQYVFCGSLAGFIPPKVKSRFFEFLVFSARRQGFLRGGPARKAAWTDSLPPGTGKFARAAEKGRRVKALSTGRLFITLYRLNLKNQERLNLANPPDPPCQGGNSFQRLVRGGGTAFRDLSGGKQLSEKPKNPNQISIKLFF